MAAKDLIDVECEHCGNVYGISRRYACFPQPGQGDVLVVTCNGCHRDHLIPVQRVNPLPGSD